MTLALASASSRLVFRRRFDARSAETGRGQRRQCRRARSRPCFRWISPRRSPSRSSCRWSHRCCRSRPRRHAWRSTVFAHATNASVYCPLRNCVACADDRRAQAAQRVPRAEAVGAGVELVAGEHGQRVRPDKLEWIVVTASCGRCAGRDDGDLDERPERGRDRRFVNGDLRRAVHRDARVEVDRLGGQARSRRCSPGPRARGRRWP